MLHSIVSITNENVYKLASKPAQGNHTAVKNMLCKLVDGRVPDLELISKSAILDKISDRLQYFVRHTPAAGTGAAPPTTFGKFALKAKLDDLKLKAEDITYDVTANDVSVFANYIFLVPEAEQAPYIAMIATAKVDAAARIGRSKAKAKGKATKNKALSEAMAMST